MMSDAISYKLLQCCAVRFAERNYIYPIVFVVLHISFGPFHAQHLAIYLLTICACQRGIWDTFSCRRSKVSNKYEISQFKTQQLSDSSQGILCQVNILNSCFYSRSHSLILSHSAAVTFHSTA